MNILRQQQYDKISSSSTITINGIHEAMIPRQTSWDVSELDINGNISLLDTTICGVVLTSVLAVSTYVMYKFQFQF